MERGAAAPASLIVIAAAVVALLGGGVLLGITRHAGSSRRTAAPASPLLSTAPTLPPTTAAAPQRCPLSGMPPSGGVVPQRPALAIKVDNYPAARPQSGLNQADVIFEEPIEAGITRLIAVFQCQGAALVGSIRSARAVDASILDELSKPIFMHVGAIAPVSWIIQQADVLDEDLSRHAYLAQSPPGRNAPYDTYISTSAGWALHPEDSVAPAPIFSYSTSPSATRAVTSVHIPYSPTNDNTWTWEGRTQRWLLSYRGVPARAADGDDIGATNVVVETVQVTYGPWTEDIQRDPEVQSQLLGSGPATVFSAGGATVGTWQRPSLAEPTHLIGPDGTTIALQPGETWVEVVPANVGVTTSPPSSAGT